MILTRDQAKAREAGCRVTIDTPSKYVSDLRLEHRWDCGCVYRFTVDVSGNIVRLPFTHCTKNGES